MMLQHFITRLKHEAVILSHVVHGQEDLLDVIRTVCTNDGYKIIALQRLREWVRANHVFGANHVLRMLQTAVYSIEIGNDVTLGTGIWFIHPIGIVIGGNAIVGNRVRFFGNNTVGTAKDNGYPVIEDDVWVGAGARILGPIRIGARARIGANAVVLSDVPADAVAVGVPAKILPQHHTDVPHA